VVGGFLGWVLGGFKSGVGGWGVREFKG